MSARGLTDKAEAARFQVILDALATIGPSTAQELADHTGINYYTLKRTMNAMVHRDMLEYTGYYRNKAQLFQPKAKTAMPQVQHVQSGTWATPKEIVASRAKTPLSQPSKAEVAAHNAVRLFMDYLVLAQQVSVGVASETDITRVRNLFATYYQDLHTLAEMLRQMSENNLIWAEDRLKLIAEAPDFPDTAWWHIATEYFKDGD